MRTLWLVVVLLGVGAGCASFDLHRALERDDEAGYRRFLAHHPEGDEAEEARQRLEELAFQRASRGGDIAAYNRFLAEFPEGDFAREARERRARLRLERAMASDDPVPWLRRIVELDHDTEAAERARRALASLMAERLSSSDDPARLRAYLATFPESEARARVERRLDDVEFERARQAGDLPALQHYLEAHPLGVHRAEAEAAIEALLADQVIASGRVGEMERFLEEHPISGEAERVRRALAERLLDSAERRLDGEAARRAIELAPESEAARRAEALLERLRRPSPRLRRLRPLLADLEGGDLVRPTAELGEALEAADPMERWEALREAAFSSDPTVIPLAIRAAGRGDPMLLFYARAVLGTWGDQRATAGRARLMEWRDRLRPRSSNPEDLLRLGAVNEALGDEHGARHAYREAAGHRETALAGAAHWALLARDVPDEDGQALATFAEAAHDRLREVLDTAPDAVDRDRWNVAVQAARALQALERLIGEVTRAYRAAPSVPLPRASDDDEQRDHALDDLDRDRAAAAAEAARLIARMRQLDPSFVASADTLQQRVRNRRRRRLAAIAGIAQIRAPEAVPALAAAALEQSDDVSRAALRAIITIDGAAAREALLRLAEDPARLAPPLRREIAAAISSLARTTRGEERRRLEAAALRLRAGAPGSSASGPRRDDIRDDDFDEARRTDGGDGESGHIAP